MINLSWVFLYFTDSTNCYSQLRHNGIKVDLICPSLTSTCWSGHCWRQKSGTAGPVFPGRSQCLPPLCSCHLQRAERPSGGSAGLPQSFPPSRTPTESSPLDKHRSELRDTPLFTCFINLTPGNHWTCCKGVTVCQFSFCGTGSLLDNKRQGDQWDKQQSVSSQLSSCVRAHWVPCVSNTSHLAKSLLKRHFRLQKNSGQETHENNGYSAQQQPGINSPPACCSATVAWVQLCRTSMEDHIREINTFT